MTPRRGTIVLGISRDNMREIYDITTGLELMAVDLLSNQKPNMDDLAPLTDALKAMRAI